MSAWWPRVVLLGLLAVIVGLPVALSERRDETIATAAADRLIILSPHNEQIRYEFGRAFNLWRRAQGMPAVVFDWRSSGGTSDLRKAVISQFEAAAREGREDAGIGADLFFGGGDFEHNLLARGITITRGGEAVSIPLTVPVDLDEETLRQVYPEALIGSERLYHPELRWVGVVLSSFGIVYNRHVLSDRLGVPEPRTWDDLADPRLADWVALADPSHSGSIAVTYEVILRRQGWDEGWAMLRRAFANARYFTASAGKVPVDVSAGEAAAGMCIDFYGRFQVGAIGGDRVGYADPPYLTAITADPVSILRGAPHPETARQFVQWLLTPQAQHLWQAKRGTAGGVEKFELRRLPARRDMYVEQGMADWTDKVNPFELARAFPPGTPGYYNAVAPLAKAMAIDIHADLAAAWRAINAEPDPRRKQRMMEAFLWMPPELRVPWPDEELRRDWRAILEQSEHPRREQVVTTLAVFAAALNARMKDADAFAADRLHWTLAFREQYRQVVAIAREKE